MAPPPATLVDDLVEEILLRLPPDDPALLVRASLACKRWRRLVSDAGFRRRFREFHRSAPMLGFFFHTASSRIRFFPTSASCPRIPARHCWCALDSRHGRVLLLLLKPPIRAFRLAIWDPIADVHRDLPTLRRPTTTNTYAASVLCAGTCGRLGCRCGKFLVVFFVTDLAGVFACVYSSQSGERWSEPAYYAQQPSYAIDHVPPVLAGNALHFFQTGTKMLTYDLGTKVFSVTAGLPTSRYICVTLMATECGGLGFAGVGDTSLDLWSRKTAGPGGQQPPWVKTRTIINLHKLLHVDRLFLVSDFFAIADGIRDTIFFLLVTVQGIFSIDLKSSKVRKVYDGIDVHRILPFESFYTPELREASAANRQR